MKIIIAILFPILTLCMPSSFADSKYPVNNDSYDRTEKEVGCLSKYSNEKKNDIFNSKYKNHWMTWRGEVWTAKSDSVTMDVNNFGIDDLSVDFEKQGAGYDLLEGQTITVQFLMKSPGGCFLNFEGELARILWK